MSNAEQTALWDGPSGEYWVAHAARYRVTGRPHLEALLATSPVRAGDAVLDVGCGTGELTRAAAALAGPSGSALGVDLSAAQVEYARSFGGGNVRYEQADAQTHDFGEGRFDALVSQFGVMFFDDPPAAFANLARAVRPGGRAALLVWGPLEQNEWASVARDALAGDGTPPPVSPGEPGPFALSSPDLVRAVLTGAGFADVELTPIPAAASWGDDLDDAYAFVLGTGMVRRALAAMDPEDADAARLRLRAMLASRLTPAGIVLRATSVLVTAVRS